MSVDFLPVRCSGCNKVFCKDHYCYDCHSCPAIGSIERQVPICPLCGVPVPTGPHESADIKVGQHIDTACQSKPALALKGKGPQANSGGRRMSAAGIAAIKRALWNKPPNVSHFRDVNTLFVTF
ncbi:unnamed protein product [Dibothriocephalus latus]|uniref:Uncharacterized protein n=1 Tax=Dibothriocephalus latus TaxID=60516 RepID=A0A3P7M227_DIBLA|nr:unnamed protein product [Dibothriocephalus latus]